MVKHEHKHKNKTKTLKSTLKNMYEFNFGIFRSKMNISVQNARISLCFDDNCEDIETAAIHKRFHKLFTISPQFLVVIFHNAFHGQVQDFLTRKSALGLIWACLILVEKCPLYIIEMVRMIQCFQRRGYGYVINDIDKSFACDGLV